MSSRSDFARVYEEHVWRVYGFLAYRLRSRETAEDLTQATFERALRAWGRFDPRRASERTWLIAIASNLLIDNHRRKHPDPVGVIEENIAPSDPGPEEGGLSSPELLTALEGLSERERHLLALRFGGDLTGPEIASIMDLSLDNVHQIISRSLRKLRTVLDDEPDGLAQASRARKSNQPG